MWPQRLRVHLRTGIRIVSEDDFALEVEALRSRNFADAPDGPVSIEALDDRDRICWRADFSDMRSLARELARERRS